MKFYQIFLPALLSSVLGSFTANEDKRLIKLNEYEPALWMTESEVLTKLIQNDINFFDITEVKEETLKLRTSTPSSTLPSTFKHQDIVRPLFDNINIDRMRSFLTSFSSFNNRYYKVQSGADASNWLLSQIKGTISSSNYTGKVTVETFSHTFIQKSIIAKIEGSDLDLKSEIVLVGSHLDSINKANPTDGRAPGADDDGSGTTCNLEAFRILLENNFKPKRSIEFHWYAGEEAGDLGSQDIAKVYYESNKKVVAQTQFDMVGYLSDESKIGLIIDYTDEELTTLIKKVINEYLNYGYIERKCGYACSDHAAWNKYGYKSAFPFEDKTNPNLHTPNDTLEHVNFTHVKEYVKLAIAFLVEVADI